LRFASISKAGRDPFGGLPSPTVKLPKYSEQMIQNQKHQNKMWVIHSSGVEIVMQAQQENNFFCRPYMGVF
jgi:hypothetical protein